MKKITKYSTHENAKLKYNTEKKSVSEVSELLKGQPGSKLTLKIRRDGEKDIITKTLTREKIKIDNIPYYTVLEGGVAYIILNQFTKDAAEYFNWDYTLMEGDMSLLEKFIAGDWDPKDFLIVPPGCRVIASYDENIISYEKITE